MEERSKYNVSQDIAKRTCNDIVFDSVMEMKYYRDVVLPEMDSGHIVKCEMQKVYELQPKFEHDGRLVRPITYVADFVLYYEDGGVDVIDVKGFNTPAAMIKRKLFWYVYPEIHYQWITYVKKYGGWVEYDTVNKLRREAKRLKKANAEVKENVEE